MKKRIKRTEESRQKCLSPHLGFNTLNFHVRKVSLAFFLHIKTNEWTRVRRRKPRRQRRRFQRSRFALGFFLFFFFFLSGLFGLDREQIRRFNLLQKLLLRQKHVGHQRHVALGVRVALVTRDITNEFRLSGEKKFRNRVVGNEHV